MSQTKTHDFRFYFNRKKQYVDVFLHDVSHETFKRKGGGRWGYFIATWEHHRKGKFGELHFVKNRLRFDTIAHELLHLWIEWMWVGGETITRKNEEKLIEKYDMILGRFTKELKKLQPRIRL